MQNTVDNKKNQAVERIIKRYYFTYENRCMYLTHREAGCVFYIMNGYTIKKTAKALELSPRTVEFYLKRIKEKLCCNTRIQLICLLTKFNVLDTLSEIDFTSI